MKKLVTFGVPCYNSASYMEKCIQSLLKGGEDVEIILVNDGSTKDNTAEIADDYARRYPTIIKAVHQENGGHGEAVNTGLKHATGLFYKVVDSDDWVDEQALEKLIATVKNFNDELPDVIFVNYVYEYTINNTQRVVKYKGKLPENELFTYDQAKPLGVGNFFMMHSVIYRTQFLKDVGLQLPKHTFYVDNAFVYIPLPHVKKFYYLDVDFYRYFIGREDQSVNEKVLMSRIDQHIRVTEILMCAHDLQEIRKKSKKLYKYMAEHVHIMMVITSIILIKIGDEQAYAKKRALWEKLKAQDIVLYKRCRRKFTGIVYSNNKLLNNFAKDVYLLARKIFKFN